MPNYRLSLLPACLLLLAPLPAQATQDDAQLWLFLQAAVPIEDGVTASFEISPRMRENEDQVLVRGNVDFRIANGVELGGGAAWVDYASGHEFRTQQQATLTSGITQFRTRIEQRFFGGADRAQWRLRQRVQVTLPVAQNLRAVANAELLYIARTESPLQQARVDSWRFNVMANYRVSQSLEIGAGYLAIYSPRAGAADRLSHVPTLRLAIR